MPGTYISPAETGLYYLQSRYYDPEIGRFINADNVISGVGGDILGYNMFVYCFNNPIIMSDSTGNWPNWSFNFAYWFSKVIMPQTVGVASGVAKDCSNYDVHNESETKVFESNYFSSYKGVFVLKTPFDASFSFGIIGLSNSQLNTNTLNHEYGHTVQLDNMGVFDYTTKVAIPSLTINLLQRCDKLKYDYYGAPWEAEADMLGEVSRTYDNTPWPDGAYNSYYDLIKMFWE